MKTGILFAVLAILMVQGCANSEKDAKSEDHSGHGGASKSDGQERPRGGHCGGCGH